jgi:hypothetical protein
MQLPAIGLVTALALASTTAFAMGGGGAGGGTGNGAGSSYTSNPAECGGLVCFLRSPPSALTVPDPRRKRLRGVRRHYLQTHVQASGDRSRAAVDERELIAGALFRPG